MPAPPARSRSASVPCGTSSSSIRRRAPALELSVLADVGGDDPTCRPGRSSPIAEAVHASVVADDRQVRHAAGDDGPDEVLGDATQAESAGRQHHAVME